jgi:RNA polymerase sigma-70 factor (ECF subfamily)
MAHPAVLLLLFRTRAFLAAQAERRRDASGEGLVSAPTPAYPCPPSEQSPRFEVRTVADPLHGTTNVDDLLARARTGDVAAENTLFACLHARILALAKNRIWDSEAAHDIAQETMRTAFEKYRDADLSHGLFPWLFTILHHKVGNYLKRRRRDIARLGPGEARLANGWEWLAAAPEGEIAYIELVDALHRALGRLPVECRKIFELLLAGAGRREICAAFPGEPLGTVDSRVSRCRARLLADLQALHAGGRQP